MTQALMAQRLSNIDRSFFEDIRLLCLVLCLVLLITVEKLNKFLHFHHNNMQHPFLHYLFL